MGWKPWDVYRATVPEFWMALTGWRKANSPESAPGNEPMTRAELDDILKGYDPNGGRTAKAANQA